MPRCRVELADLDRPADTSALAPCDEAQTAAAIEVVRSRLLRRRTVLIERQARAGEVDKIVAALRRLNNPQLAAYSRGDCVLLSEPFNAVACASVPAELSTAYACVRAMFRSAPPRRVVRALAAFGEPALVTAVRSGVHIDVVPHDRRYSEYSSAIAKLVPGIDDWSAPPSGLFVVEERRILLRDRAMAMTAAHEFAHALDCVLATRPRSYFSYESDALRHYFATATGFVNEYAASALDEYFAESVRAYLEINDPHCAWLPLTRKELRVRDAPMFGLIEDLFRSRFVKG